MDLKLKSYSFSLFVGILAFFLWKISGIPLTQWIATDYTVLPHPTDNTLFEYLIYFVISALLSACFYLPFYLSKKIDQPKQWGGIGVSVCFLFFLVAFVSTNIKGVLISNWFGEDHGFGVNLTKTVFMAPILYYLLNKWIFSDLRFQSFCHFFLMSFVIYFLCGWLSPVDLSGIERNIRFILLDGYFIFFFALAFGWTGTEASRVASAAGTKFLSI